MAEAAIVIAITRHLHARGAWVLKTHGTVTGRTGIPDLIVCARGHLVALEVKVPGRHATRLQQFELARIRAAGGTAHVVTSVRQVRDILNQLERPGRHEAA